MTLLDNNNMDGNVTVFWGTMLKILLVVMSILVTSVAVADHSRLVAKIKQLKPRVEAAVVVGIACLVSICSLQLSTPAIADVYELSSRMELLRRRNVFLHLGNLDVAKSTRVAKWLGAGGVVEQEKFLSTFEAGLDVQSTPGSRPFNFFLNGRLKNQVDDVNLEPEIRTGMDFFIMKYYLDKTSGTGYINAELLLTEEILKPLALRFYLFFAANYLNDDPYGLAALGYEYFSGENEKLLGTEELNGHLFSLLRYGDISENFLPGEVGIVSKGINWTFGGGVFYQEEALNIINKSSIKGLFVRVGGHIDYILYVGGLNIGFAGENKTVAGKAGTVVENSFNMTTEIDVFPKYDVRLEGSLNIIQQILITKSGIKKLHEDDRGGSVVFLLKKGFD